MSYDAPLHGLVGPHRQPSLASRARPRGASPHGPLSPGDREDVSMVARVTGILSAFTPHDDSLGPSELSRRTGLAKSTAARIAGELAEHHLLERSGTAAVRAR